MPTKIQRSGQDELPAQWSPSVELLDPSERLKLLQAELIQHNTRIDHLSQQRDVLQTDISGLSTTVEQVKSTVTNYGSGLKDLHNRFQALEYFYHQKHKMVLAAIAERKPLIDDLIRSYDEELARMESHLQELADKQSAAQAESARAASMQEERQSEYDKATSLQQSLTAKLTEMETLRAEITKADDTTDAASMYFLTLEFHSQMQQTRILSQHDLSFELRQRLSELEAAKERARAQSAALSTAQAEYTAYKSELDAKRTNRRDNLLVEIKECFPLPAEPNSTEAGETATATTPSTPEPAPTPASENPVVATTVTATTPKK